MSANGQILNRNNNFNLIRTYLSLNVLFYHCYELSAQASLEPLGRLFNGERAVQAFFIISGYLITRSYQRTGSIKEFFIKRLRRIYPAYATVIFFCIGIGSVISTYTLYEYFTSGILYRYLAANLFFMNFIQPVLPGVFESNRFATVNGSLWTLKLEVGYYLIVPAIFYLRSKVNVHLLYAVLFILSLGYLSGMLYVYQQSHNERFLFLSRQIPGQLFYFVAGSWLTELEKNKWFQQLVKTGGIPCLIVLFFPVPVLLQVILLMITIFYFAFIVPPLSYPGKTNDFSYGIYIYHFPVIQLLASYGIFSYQPWYGAVAATAITIMLSMLSWFFIEKHFLVRKKKTHHSSTSSINTELLKQL